jgi:hypothetical protein
MGKPLTKSAPHARTHRQTRALRHKKPMIQDGDIRILESGAKDIQCCIFTKCFCKGRESGSFIEHPGEMRVAKSTDCRSDSSRLVA